MKTFLSRIRFLPFLGKKYSKYTSCKEIIIIEIMIMKIIVIISKKIIIIIIIINNIFEELFVNVNTRWPHCYVYNICCNSLPFL